VRYLAELQVDLEALLLHGGQLLLEALELSNVVLELRR